MAQSMSFWEFEEYYLKQCSIVDQVRSKVDLEAMKIILKVKNKTDEKDLKDWKKAMNNLKNKKISLGGK